MDCFQALLNLLDFCEENKNSACQSVIETIICRLEFSVKFVEQILPLVSERKNELSEVATNLQILFHKWCRKLQETELRYTPNCTHLAVYSVNSPKYCISNGPGRPKFEIDEETLLHFRNLGFTWKDIARLLLVSRCTLWRRVRELGIAKKTGFSDITDEELDNIIRAFMNDQGNLVGYSMVSGCLKDIGLRVQRDRVRASIARVDPVNSRLRWATVISRRTYSVAAPNSLWHIDGHHSLINWGFVIHGCIDGYSRLICFLKCSTNNRKETVESLFLQSVQKYSWPSRIRTDHGGENVLVWEHMITFRGSGRGSVLVGSSTRNQRIERLWRDVFRCFGNVFYYTFQSMEEMGLLDISNPLHKFMLHYIYLPRINSAVTNFVAAWNKHPLRTERNWSPEQIWCNGMIDRANKGLCAVAEVTGDVDVPDDNLPWYGFDSDAPLPPDSGLSTVEVNDLNLDLPDEVISQLTDDIDPLQNSSVFGIDIFQRGVILLQHILDNHNILVS